MGTLGKVERGEFSETTAFATAAAAFRRSVLASMMLNASISFLLASLLAVYREELENGKHSRFRSVTRVLSGLRIIAFPTVVLKFGTTHATEKLQIQKKHIDSLYFITHTYYVSKRFTLAQRVEIAVNHHDYELDNYNDEYLERIYRSDGLLLWDQPVENHRFTLNLAATEDNRHEGELSVILSVDNIRLCRVSFCYLNAKVVGLISQMTLLISRNQTDRTPERVLFDRYFKNNTPNLFCLSAVCGIAMANDFETVLGIRHDSQIAYETTYDAGFRNSYTALWEKFDATEIDGHVYTLNIPLKLRSVHMVECSHRSRARNRRKHWDEIVRSARSSMMSYRVASVAPCG